MKAQVIRRFGDANVFETIEIPKPEIKPGHVLIRVMATSVNPVDGKIRKGLYDHLAPPFPAVLHGDVAGIVDAVAPDVTSFNVGDEVYGCAGGLAGTDGALAEFMGADVKFLAKKPQSLNFAEAAALPLVSITAWEALYDKVKIQAHQKVLVHGGTGGVGHIGIQLAKIAGADVYATVSSEEKAQMVKSLGAKEAINYQKESVQDYVQRLTNGKGFDIIFDTIGGEHISTSLQAMSLYGQVISIIANPNQDLTELFRKSGSLHAVFMLLPLIFNVQRERHGKIMGEIAKFVDQGKLRPLIDPHIFTFEQVGAAHAFLESGEAIGKIVIQRK